MTDAPKLHHYRFAYELDDGTAGTVDVHNRSLIAWDETRAKRKWPEHTEAPTLWQTFLIWHALSRAGDYAGKFDDFKEICVAQDVLNAAGEPVSTKALSAAFDDDEDDDDDPTTRAAAAIASARDAAVEVDPTLRAVEPG